MVYHWRAKINSSRRMVYFPGNSECYIFLILSWECDITVFEVACSCFTLKLYVNKKLDFETKVFDICLRKVIRWVFRNAPMNDLETFQLCFFQLWIKCSRRNKPIQEIIGLLTYNWVLNWHIRPKPENQKTIVKFCVLHL